MMGKKFDDIISKPTPESWELFEEKLDAAMSAGEEPSLPTSSFDEIILGKLTRLEAEKDPQAWSRFKQKLDSSPETQPVPASSFDQMIATFLKRQQPAYNHNHWLILKERLDWISFITNRLALYKFSELALLLLLLVYLGQSSVPSEPASGEADLPVAAQQLQQDNEPALEQPAPLAPQELSVIKTPLDQKIPAKADGHSSELSSQPADLPELAHSQDPYLQLPDKPRKLTGHYPEEYRSTQLVDAMLPLQGVGLKVLPEDRQAILDRFALSMTENNIPQTREDIRLEDLAGIEAKPLAPERFLALSQLKKPVEQTAVVNFSMMGALDYNRIITPENKEFRLTAFDRYEVGYGGGFLVGIEKGRLGLQTGGIYSFKHVRPIRLAYTEGNFDEGYFGEVLKEYDYSTISVPLNLTFDVFRKNSWRFYAVAGASLHLVYEANYYVVLNRGKNTGGYGLAGSGYGSANTANTRTRLDDVNFPRGWFQGGSFAENSYITTNIGLGVEKFLEDRWSIFAQPTYHHGLIFMKEGLGPFKDQLRTMSFFTGIRVRLIK